MSISKVVNTNGGKSRKNVLACKVFITDFLKGNGGTPKFARYLAVFTELHRGKSQKRWPKCLCVRTFVLAEREAGGK
jgi:hypothetical protein